MPLVQFGCSSLLKFFLCSLYAPMCTVQVDEPMVIPACRSMCVEVRRRCEPVLLRFNFRWPAVLDCSQLPERSDRSNLCIDPPPEVDSSHVEMEHAGVDGTQLPNNPGWAKLLDAFRGGVGKRGTPPPPRHRHTSRPVDAARTGRGVCWDRFVATTSRNNSAPVVCAVGCGIDVLFTQSDKHFVSTWMTVWALLCLVSSLFAVLTFAIDTSRFDYPQRPVIFLSACCACQSVAYLIRAVVGPETISCDVSDVGQPLFVIREGLESIWCMTISLILYFFGMASATWWVGLAVAWYLASARRWGREAIQACAGYFHLVAWTLPAVQTIVALALRRVDGDELTGLCYVGNQDSTALAAFVVAPTALYLLVGAAFIIVGFLSLRSVRRDLKHHQQQQHHHQSTSLMSGGNSNSDVHKLEKLMAKIGFFSVLYVLSTSALLAALFYQLLHVDLWLQAAKQPCRKLSRNEPDYKQVGLLLRSALISLFICLLIMYVFQTGVLQQCYITYMYARFIINVQW